MSSVRSAQDASLWGPAIDEAVNAIGRGANIVLPTDTVYGIGADAFNEDAVAGLLRAKGRGRDMPPPVLIGNVATMSALAIDIPDGATALAEKFWPGGLTLILRAQPSLAWDLGETNGTVALRVPDHPTAIALLSRTGPLAVSSANTSGQPAAVTAQEAQEQLGTSVAVYLDAGHAPGQVASTIVDATGPRLKVVRQGAISLEALREITDVADISENVHATEDEQTETDGQTESDGQPLEDSASAKASALLDDSAGSNDAALSKEAAQPRSAEESSNSLDQESVG